MPPDSDLDQQQIDTAVEYILEAEKVHGVFAYRIGDEWGAVLALRATSLTDFAGGLILAVARRELRESAGWDAEAERRRPNGRRVHTIAKSQDFLESATRHRERAVAAESRATSMMGVSDLTAAHSAVAYMKVVEAVDASGSSPSEWALAQEVATRARKLRKKRQQWNYVRGRAVQAFQPRGGLLPLTSFDRYEFGGSILTRATETGPPGTIASAVELLIRWDLLSDPRAKSKPSTASLEAIRAIRRGEHTATGPGTVAATMRSRVDDVFDEIEWEDEEDETFTHITEMRARACRWFGKFGRPIQPDAWIVQSDQFHLDGHIDFVTADTIWDLKVSASPPSRSDVLQILLYWLVFQNDESATLTVTHIGLYNPRLDVAWRIAIVDIPVDVVTAVEAIATSDGP